VYRRRRIVALVIVLLPLAIVLRACTAGSTAPTPSPSPTAKASAAQSSAAKASAAKATAAKATETATVKAETATITESATPKATPTPKIGDCANSDVAVTLTADAESYAIGSPVTLATRITNKGTVACKRDIGALPNEVYVTNLDGAVVWSSDACQANAKPQVIVMQPGAVFGNTQVWSGANSGRDCTSAAPDASPGSYLAYARNDTVVSKPFAFAIT